MKLAVAVVLAVLLGGAGGFGVAHLMDQDWGSTDSNLTTQSEREILYWVAPMDSNFKRDGPGKSPMGMDLVPVYAPDRRDDPSTVAIEPAVVQNLGIRSEQVAKSRLNRKINTVGFVEYDENALQHIHTRVDGWIEKLSVKAEGDPVESGQVLFEIYSRTLVNAQQEFLLAKSGDQSALASASRERLASLGMTRDEIEKLDRSNEVIQRVKVFSPADGVVGMLGIREGVHVTPSTHVMSIADLERVWIRAEVLERHADLIKIGQVVAFEVDSKKGRVFEGQVEYVYPDLNPTTRSLQVRIGYSVQNDVFRPNMFARVSIVVDGDEDVYHVPRTAVIRGGLTDRVVLDLGNGRFKSTPVVLGMEAAARVEIIRGVSRTDSVVISGQFLIDSESNIESALARFQ